MIQVLLSGSLNWVMAAFPRVTQLQVRRGYGLSVPLDIGTANAAIFRLSTDERAIVSQFICFYCGADVLNLRGLFMVNIRPYQSTDWSRLCEIHDASRLDELRLTVGTDAFLTLEQTAEGEGLFDDKLVVAEVDGVVQGFVAYSDDELTWLYVDPQSYKKGVGRSLVRHAIVDSASAIELEVLEGNTPALRLYLSEGFKVVKRSEGKLVGNEEFAAVGLVLRHEPSANRFR